jgi:hypothetical protein
VRAASITAARIRGAHASHASPAHKPKTRRPACARARWRSQSRSRVGKLVAIDVLYDLKRVADFVEVHCKEGRRSLKLKYTTLEAERQGGSKVHTRAQGSLTSCVVDAGSHARREPVVQNQECRLTGTARDAAVEIVGTSSPPRATRRPSSTASISRARPTSSC